MTDGNTLTAATAFLALIVAGGCHQTAGQGTDAGSDTDADTDADTDTDTDADTDTDTDTLPMAECPDGFDGFICFADVTCDNDEDGSPDVDWTWLGVLGVLPGESRHPEEFTIHDDGTATDEVTGFTWQRCTYPEAGGDACGFQQEVSNSSANAGPCEEAYGPGWRIPTVGELSTLIDFGKSFYLSSVPCWELETFPNPGVYSGGTLRYRSGTWYVLSPSLDHFDITFGNYARGSLYSGKGRIRCILDWSAGEPGARYAVDPGEPGEVMDLGTGLTWMRCPLGREWNGETCEGEVELFSSAEAEDACTGGWRLPTAVEALSILNRCFRPATNPAVFPGSEGMWTSTFQVYGWEDDEVDRVYVNRLEGTFRVATTEGSRYVRCVK